MAEAHAAVAFQFTVTQEGLNVQVSHENKKEIVTVSASSIFNQVDFEYLF